MAEVRKINDDRYKLILMYLFIVAAFVTIFLCSCTTQRESESGIYLHRMALMTEKVDSMIHSENTWQKSLYEKQTALVDSFKHSEVRDTSHAIFLGAKGDTVKEIITIKEIIEREHTTHENTQEYWEERFRQTDSLLQVAIKKQSENDSVLQSYHKETVVEKETTFVDKLKWFAGGIVLTIIGCIACCTAFMKNRS